MNVFPVLLLFMQFMAAVLGGVNETAIGNQSVSNVTTTVLSPVNMNNETAAATTTGTSTLLKLLKTEGNVTNPTEAAKKPQLDNGDKPGKVNSPIDNSPVLTRRVSNTSTLQAATSWKPNITSTITTQTPKSNDSASVSATVITNAQAKTTPKSDKPLAEGVSRSDIDNNKSNSTGSKTTPAGIGKSNVTSISINSSSTISTTTTTPSTTTPATTLKTTIKTTLRPLKPNITRSMSVPVAGEKDQQLNSAAIGSASVDASIKSDPISQPVQEMISLPNHDGNEYIVPIVTVMLTVPLAIVVFIIMYRRFRDLWTTRHYRRMDFLVDGMYND